MKKTWKIGRKLFNFAAAFSLVCCVLTVGMWWRSYRVIDLKLRVDARPFVHLISERGIFAVCVGWTSFKEVNFSKWSGDGHPVTGVGGDFSYLEVLVAYFQDRGAIYGAGDVLLGKEPFAPPYVFLRNHYHNVYQSGGELIICLQYWMIAIASAVLPAWWAIHRVRFRHKSAFELCTACGYDLRVTPDRCPECGKEVAGKPSAEAS